MTSIYSLGRRWISLVSLWTLITCGLVFAQSTPQVRRLAISGEPAPGAEPALFFQSTAGAAAKIDRFGNFGMNAFLSGTENNSGIWKHVGGSLNLVALQGQHAPGTDPGVTFGHIPGFFEPIAPVIANRNLLFDAELEGPGVQQFVNQLGLWSETSTGLSLVVRQGQVPPGVNDGRVFNFVAGTVNEPGHIAVNGVYGQVGSSGFDANSEGLWSNRSGSLQLVARSGMRAPGTSEGIVFGAATTFASGGSFRSWSFSPQSRFAVVANLAGQGIHDLNDEGIWVETDAGLQLLVREGDTAVGFGSRTHFGSSTGIGTFDPIGVHRGSSGAVLFGARVSGGDVGFAEALYTNRSGSLQLLVEARDLGASPPGDQAPGLPPGATFTGLITSTGLNANDRTAIHATTNDPSPSGLFNFGIWSDANGALRLVAADGIQVPDLPLGTMFGNPAGDYNTFTLAGMSDNGRVAFISALQGQGIDSSNDLALFLTDGTGVPRIVLRRGSQFDVHGNGTDLRTISDIRSIGLTGRGEVAVQLLFSNATIGFFAICDALCQATPQSTPTTALPPPPPPVVQEPQLVLSASVDGNRQKKTASLSWTGARTSRVDIFRDGRLLTTTANDGSYSDQLRIRTGTLEYKVCEEGSFFCSPTVTVRF